MMTLTPAEDKMVRRIRKTVREWPRARWVLLIVAIGGIAVYLRLWKQMYDLIEGVSLGVAGYTLIVPFFVFAPAMCGWLLGFVLSQWRGDPIRTLLLRLIDESNKK
ncbi:MAG: hypothetical protein C0404_14495 [Verrucomicrobia bacterium]|nr:hypothetical protein [Verrucomicrobiota bacterium]